MPLIQLAVMVARKPTRATLAMMMLAPLYLSGRGGMRRFLVTASAAAILAVTPLSSSPDSTRRQTLGLALQAEGADGVADEALHDHDEGGKDAELDAVIGNGILHGEGGDNAAGEDGRADDDVVPVGDDEAAEEVECRG